MFYLVLLIQSPSILVGGWGGALKHCHNVMLVNKKKLKLIFRIGKLSVRNIVRKQVSVFLDIGCVSVA